MTIIKCLYLVFDQKYMVRLRLGMPKIKLARPATEVEKISVSEFKTHALRLLARVKDSRKPIAITKRGEVIAHIIPAEGKQQARSSAGILKGTVLFEGDLLSPLDSDDWEALK